MIFYLTLMLLAGSVAYCASLAQRRCFVWFWSICTFLVLFLPAALRYGVGTDYVEVYPLFFEQICSGDDIAVPPEPFVKLIALAVPFFCGDGFEWNYQIFIALMSGLTYLFIMMAVERKFWWIAILVYFAIQGYTGSYNLVRQSLSVAVMMYAVRIFSNGHLWRSLVVVAAATFIHKSSMLCLPVFLFATVYDVSIERIAIATILTCLALKFMPITHLVNQAVEHGWYSHYEGHETYLAPLASSSGIGNLLKLIADAFVLWGLMQIRRNKYILFLSVLVALRMITRVAGLQVWIINRYNELWMIGSLLAIVEICKQEKMTYKMHFSVVVAFVLMLITFARDLIPAADGVARNGVVPYESVLGKSSKELP